MHQLLRYAFRALAKRPAFTAIVVITFALGIGANTAVFSVLDAVLLRPLAFPEPQKLVAISPYDIHTGPQSAWDTVSYLNFTDWRAQVSDFERMAVYTNQSLTLTDRETAVHVQSEAVSADLFALLRAQPLLGRTFTAAEDNPGRHVAILSYAFWQNRFGKDSGIIGRDIVLDGREFAVVGVMPPTFQYPIQNTPVDVWTTVSVLRETSDGSPPMSEQRGNDFLHCIARLQPGASLAQAQAKIDAINANLRREYPDADANYAARVVPLVTAIVGDTRPALLMLSAMAACVLLVACVNVANLLLARSLSRQKEISIRAALGASRWNIVRQLLTESALLGLLGGFAGLLLACWGIDLLRGVLPATIPRLGEVTPDFRVLAFTGCSSIFVGLLAGLLPAWRASHPNVAMSLHETARGSTAAGGRRTRAALVIFEITLALVLLASAGLLVTSFLRLQKVRPGFDPNNVATARLTLPDNHYAKPEQVAEFCNKLLANIRALPGVRDASAAWWIPLSGSEISFNVDIQEHPLPKAQQPVTQTNAVAVDYFKTLRVPLLRGREFVEQDTMKSPPVAVVTESFERQFFPGENAVGKRITLQGSILPGDPPVREIVGVVPDLHLISLGEKPKPQVYLPHGQFPVQTLSLFVRTDIDARSVNGVVANAVANLDKDIPVYRARLLSDYLAASIAQPRFNALLVGLFAAITLLLAAAGIFGVMSYTVNQRTQEIGIRLALGAQRGHVWRLILGEGIRLAAIGAGLGLILVFAVRRLLGNLLYGIGVTDPSTLLVVTLLLGIVAFIACWWPARRAARVDPIIALRSE